MERFDTTLYIIDQSYLNIVNSCIEVLLGIDFFDIFDRIVFQNLYSYISIDCDAIFE